MVAGQRVLRLYKDKCNGNKDSFIHTCRKKVERIKEDDLWADGEFMTEQDMIDDNYRQTRIQAIIAECRKHKGWVRRDKYEKNVECFWVETKVGGRKLKRRRETICEDDSMSEDEAGKFKKEFDDNAMPGDFDLPEDTTDPAILVEADGEADTKKALKQICFPLMDDDGLPSSYIQKILGAIGKWKLKMHGIITSLSLLEDPPETVEALAKRAADIDSALCKVETEITRVNTKGIIDSFSSEHQDELESLYKDAKKECAEALSLCTRGRPFMNHIKAEQRKRERDRDEGNTPCPQKKTKVKTEPKSRK